MTLMKLSADTSKQVRESLTPCQADPDLWFSESLASTALAKSICSSCPLQGKCLELAISGNEVHGVWGGVDFSNPEERILDDLILCRAKKHLRKRGENCRECSREAKRRYAKKVRKGYDKPNPQMRRKLRALKDSST
jgi:hypothetical protein